MAGDPMANQLRPRELTWIFNYIYIIYVYNLNFYLLFLTRWYNVYHHHQWLGRFNKRLFGFLVAQVDPINTAKENNRIPKLPPTLPSIQQRGQDIAPQLERLTTEPRSLFLSSPSVEAESNKSWLQHGLVRWKVSEKQPRKEEKWRVVKIKRKGIISWIHLI
jgi:hypothetical protein